VMSNNSLFADGLRERVFARRGSPVSLESSTVV
jgi:hypothetical protein